MSTPRLVSLLFLLPVVFLALVWADSSGSVAVPPVHWAVALFVAAMALALAAGRGRPRWYDFLFAALGGIVATHRLLFPGFPPGHDADMHLWGVYGFAEALRAGNYFPRWIHELGLGMPLLLFYPPLPFYALTPALALNAPVYDALKFGLILFNLLSGVSMLYVVGRWTGDRRAALVAAVAYCFAPIHLLQSHYRVAVAEAASMAVLPLFFYYAHQLLDAPWQRLLEMSPRRRLAAASFWTGILALTHPLTLTMAGVGMGVWTVAAHRWRPGRPLFRALALLALATGLGIGLAGAYSIPAAAEGSYATIKDTVSAGEHPLYYWHGIEPKKVLERREWSHWQRGERRGSPAKQDEMPFYFGLGLLASLPLALRRGSPSVPRGLVTMVIVALVLPLYPFDVLLAEIPPITMVGFPWRFLTIATCGASIVVGFATLRLLDAVAGLRGARLVPGLVLGLLIFDFLPYTGVPGWNPPYRGLYGLEAADGINPLPFRVDAITYPPADPDVHVSILRDMYPEYYTRITRDVYLSAHGAQERATLERAAVGLTLDRKRGLFRLLDPAPYAEFRPMGGGSVRALEFTRGGERIRVKLPGEAGTLVLKEQWFPGWVAELSGREASVGRTWDGLMAFRLSSMDTGELSLYFSRTRWDRLGGLLLSLGTGIGLAIAARGGRRREGLEAALRAEPGRLEL